MKHEQYTLKNGLIIRKHGFSISQTMPLNIVYKVLLSRATTYSAWCVALSKKKDVVVKKIFKNYIGFLGYPKKILIGNGGEFCNNEFKTLYEIFNIRICTTAAESPCKSDLIERHNAILGLTVFKTTQETNCDLEVAVAWEGEGVSVFIILWKTLTDSQK